MINRLIILGNGFDLAHGLKTKYSDFMQNYYSNIKDSDWEDDFFEFNAPGYLLNYNDLDSIITYIANKISYDYRYYPSENKVDFGYDQSINIKNTFFYELSTIHSVQNWVDIENEYFKKMLKILDNPLGNKFKEIKKLNIEMDMISKKFEEYLSKNVINEIEKCYNEKIDNQLSDFEGYMDNNSNIFLNEFPKKYSNEMQTMPVKISFPYGRRFLSTLILNFNYTPTFELLYNGHRHNTEIINIHGELNDIDNPINLGFGDEMSKRYSEIEDYNENEYLRLMKSFAYSKTDNYKRLFDFVETNNFQVYMMGHSCGISDRTLLNAIFENHNCKSIKVFYHETINDDGTKKDNYSDIVMNISRHFNKKTMMREKIVNKEYCEPLPQFAR